MIGALIAWAVIAWLVGSNIVYRRRCRELTARARKLSALNEALADGAARRLADEVVPILQRMEREQ